MSIVVVSPATFRANQKKYFDMAKDNRVIVKRSENEMFEIVRTEAIEEKMYSAREVIEQVHAHIDTFDKK